MATTARYNVRASYERGEWRLSVAAIGTIASTPATELDPPEEDCNIVEGTVSVVCKYCGKIESAEWIKEHYGDLEHALLESEDWEAIDDRP